MDVTECTFSLVPHGIKWGDARASFDFDLCDLLTLCDLLIAATQKTLDGSIGSTRLGGARLVVEKALDQSM